MRATTAVPSTVLAATVTATMAEAVRKHLASTSWFAIKREALECGTQSEIAITAASYLSTTFYRYLIGCSGSIRPALQSFICISPPMFQTD